MASLFRRTLLRVHKVLYAYRVAIQVKLFKVFVEVRLETALS